MNSRIENGFNLADAQTESTSEFKNSIQRNIAEKGMSPESAQATALFEVLSSLESRAHDITLFALKPEEIKAFEALFAALQIEPKDALQINSEARKASQAIDYPHSKDPGYEERYLQMQAFCREIYGEVKGIKDDSIMKPLTSNQIYFYSLAAFIKKNYEPASVSLATQPQIQGLLQLMAHALKYIRDQHRELVSQAKLIIDKIEKQKEFDEARKASEEPLPSDKRGLTGFLSKFKRNK
jgi:hypothetical protein